MTLFAAIGCHGDQPLTRGKMARIQPVKTGVAFKPVECDITATSDISDDVDSVLDEDWKVEIESIVDNLMFDYRKKSEFRAIVTY